jgi:hypothetical protein
MSSAQPIQHAAAALLTRKLAILARSSAGARLLPRSQIHLEHHVVA